ncbi:MAG: family 10 glycosylhydrolase [Bacteroidales bacterium]
MRKFIYLIVALGITFGARSQSLPKREFRGAWIHTVGNQQFKNMSADSIKKLFITTLDNFERAGVNAVIFQVRPQADAFYISDIEPWSRFLSGEQGVAPKEIWDPLQFIIEESHKRGMELHAWCNPYRVTSNDQEQLHPDHLYFKKPEIFKKYGKQLYFDPGEPESVEHTVKVIADIVSRYDVDAIHFDDYFYPYPIAFEEFHDDASFVKHAAKQGFEYWQKGDWRRNNVATLIKELNDTIKAIKPWVRFGISPFGIHRNLKDTPDGSGSKTNGLSNYEQLFADIPHWLSNGWVDYNVPQIYWKIGHPAADYKTLIEWWNAGNFGRHLYIGQNISTFREPDLENPGRSQFKTKMEMTRTLPNVHGNVWWPGWTLNANPDGFTDSLAINYQSTIALVPVYDFLDSVAPEPVSFTRIRGGKVEWGHNYLISKGDKLQEPQFFAIYRFPEDVEINIENSKYLFKVVQGKSLTLTKQNGKRIKYKYLVTAIDRCRNESKPGRVISSSY